MMNTGVAVMQSQVNSAMNSQVSFSVGSASSDGNGRDLLQLSNQTGGQVTLDNLPSEQQVLETLTMVSEVAGDTKMVCGTAAIATSAVPLVSATFATAAGTVGFIETAADATKVMMTQNPKDAIKLGINIATGKVGEKIGGILKNTVAGDNLEEVTSSFINGAVEAIEGVTSTLINDKINE